MVFSCYRQKSYLSQETEKLSKSGAAISTLVVDRQVTHSRVFPIKVQKIIVATVATHDMQTYLKKSNQHYNR